MFLQTSIKPDDKSTNNNELAEAINQDNGDVIEQSSVKLRLPKNHTNKQTNYLANTIAVDHKELKITEGREIRE